MLSFKTEIRYVNCVTYFVVVDLLGWAINKKKSYTSKCRGIVEINKVSQLLNLSKQLTDRLQKN